MRRLSNFELPSFKGGIVLQSRSFVSVAYNSTFDQAPYDCDESSGMPDFMYHRDKLFVAQQRDDLC